MPVWETLNVNFTSIEKLVSEFFIVQTELFVNYLCIDWYVLDDNDYQSV